MSDSVPSIDSLLVHRDFVRALARRLLRDEHLAEDAVQETFLAASARGPRNPGRTRSWLAAIVANVARKTIRGEVRRRAREEVAARERTEPTAGTEELRSRERIRREVVEAVLELHEPLRSAVIFRYFEERPPREIARILKVPVNTVRSRLRLAHAKLRERLDERHGADRAAWTLPLYRWLSTRSAHPGPGHLPAGALGVLLMSAKARSVAAVAALLVIAGTAAWWSFGPTGRKAPKEAPDVAATPPAVPGTAKTEAGERAGGPASGPVSSRPTGGTLEGALARADGSRPAAGAEVTLTAPDGTVLRTKTDERGRFSFPGVGGEGPFVLEARVEGLAPFVFPGLRVGAGKIVRPYMPGLEVRSPLTVSVRSVDGHPVTGARVGAVSPTAATWWAVHGETGPTPPPAFTAESDAKGAASFSDLGAGRWFLLVAKRGYATVFESVELPRGGDGTRFTVTLPPATGISGRVLDGTGAPVAGVLVGAGPAPAETGNGNRIDIFYEAWTRRVRTDAAGRYAFTDLPAGEYLLRGRAPSGDTTLPVSARLPGVADLDLVLDTRPRGEVAGAVTERATGKPVPGVELSAGSAQGTSGADGRYRLTGIEAGDVVVSILAPGWFAGFPPIRRVQVRAGETATADFSLSRGGRITGRVLGPSGPVAGASVIVAAAGLGGAGPVETDADGRYEVTGLAPGSYHVVAAAPGLYLPGATGPGGIPSRAAASGAGGLPPVVVAAEGTATRDVRLEPAGTIRGVVVDPAGHPIAGAEVRTIGNGFGAQAVATTAADGTFTLAPVTPEAETQVQVRADGYATEGVIVRLPAPEPEHPAEIRMLPLPQVEGVVRTADGRVVAGARVRIDAESPLRRHTLSPVEVRTGPDGRYEAAVPGVAGTFSVTATAPGEGSAKQAGTHLEAGRTNYRVDLELPGTGAIAGRVVESGTGHGVPGATILIGRSGETPETAAARTDPEGRFRIEGLVRGEVELLARAPGYAGPPPVPARVPGAGEIRIVLVRALAIAGRVRRRDGSPVADAEVLAFQGGTATGNPAATGHTDAAGEFRLSGLTPGSYRLSVRVEGGGSAEVSGVAAGATGVVLELTTGGTISGRVVDEEGHPVPGCGLIAYPEAGLRGVRPATGRTDADGRFRLSPEGAGPFHIRASMPRGIGRAVEYRNAELDHVSPGANDLVLVVGRAHSISGRVRSRDGSPLPDGTMVAMPANGDRSQMGAGRVFPGGQFQIDALAPGPYQLHFFARDARRGLLVVEGGGAHADETGVEVVVAGGESISGICVDDSGTPLAGIRVTGARADLPWPASTQTDDRGRFVIAGVAAGASLDLRAFAGPTKKGECPGVTAGRSDVRIVLR